MADINLDTIQIASPCKANWEEMKGDERTRFCGLCKLNVYNLSAMSRDDAAALLVSHEGRMCVRLYRRSDGRLLTRDCPVGLAARLKARARRVRFAILSLIGALAAGIGLSRWRSHCTVIGGPTMGEMAAPVERLGKIARP